MSERRYAPGPEGPTRYSPARVARSVVWTSIAAVRESSVPSQVNSPISRCSAANTVPATSTKRTSALLMSAIGSRVVVWTPGAWVTSARRALRRPSSGETVWRGKTVALPPPSVRATAALGPITATRRSDPASSGSSEPWLRASTKLAAAVARSSAEISSSLQ